jgi:hypothetical protein
MQVFALQGIGLEREVYVGAQVAFQSSLTLLAVLLAVLSGNNAAETESASPR